jgi:4-diphosphocytidyl-2-C-methyl-D-erythritol kinase
MNDWPICQSLFFMVSFPPCKINLGLHVVSKRPDGYHELETCFFPVPWTDVLEILPAKETTFTASGNIIPGNADENLCLKAYHLMAAEHKLPPVYIHLHKIIPTGAGLGGGSSDGAYTLRTLNNLFELKLSTAALMDLAAKLGSDCAFFVQDQPMIGRGRGEKLSPTHVDLKGKFLTLIKPDIHVRTASAYALVKPTAPLNSLERILDKALSAWKELLVNDFERSVFEQYPAIGKIKDDLYKSGASYACMSGSGATVFGIFEKPIDLSPFRQHQVWSGTL